GAVGARGLDDAPVVTTRRSQGERGRGSLEDAIDHFALSRRESEAAARQRSVAEERPQDVRIDRQRLRTAKLTRRRVDPESMPVALATQHRQHLLGLEHAGLGPSAVVDAPQMLAGAGGGAPVGERHAIDRLDALWEDSAHERAPAVDGRELVTQAEV